MRVLLVEDDHTAAEAIALIMRAKNAIVDAAETGEAALEFVQHNDYDIVVLDLMLPDMEGFEVIRLMRQARIGTPVLILSGSSEQQAKLMGFTAGADDFISKPFNNGELWARMHAIIRRSKALTLNIVQIGSLRLNIDGKEADVDGKIIPLTAREYSILELLVLRRDVILTKEAFLHHLYSGRDEPEMKIIDVFICKLRKKLACVGLSDLIRTIWGQGYTIRPITSASGTMQFIRSISLA